MPVCAVRCAGAAACGRETPWTRHAVDADMRCDDYCNMAVTVCSADRATRSTLRVCATMCASRTVPSPRATQRSHTRSHTLRHSRSRSAEALALRSLVKDVRRRRENVSPCARRGARASAYMCAYSNRDMGYSIGRCGVDYLSLRSVLSTVTRVTALQLTPHISDHHTRAGITQESRRPFMDSVDHCEC